MKQEVVILVGLPSSGKSTIAKKYEEQGYLRLNRDTIGGKIDKLVPLLDKALSKGKNVVLDNTHCTSKVRGMFITVGKKHDAFIKGIWVQTSSEDCATNAALRMLEKHDRLLSPEELKSSKDPNMFPPKVIGFFKSSFQEPILDEGFDEIEDVPFERKWGNECVNKVAIFDYDGTIRQVSKNSTNGMYPVNKSEIQIMPGRKEKLQEYKDKGYLLLGISNQSGVDKGILSWDDCNMLFQHTNKLLGHDIDYLFCAHTSSPGKCYCRKPYNGHVMMFVQKYKISLKDSIFVGDMNTDAECAKRSGMKYFDQKDFFI